MCKIRNKQHAFCQGLSTSLQLVVLIYQSNQNISLSEYTAAIFFNVKKMFDILWHNGLLHKIHLLDIPTNLMKIINSFSFYRTFVITVDNQSSSIRKIQADLCPTLFIIFAKDLPLNPNASIALFADDTMFFLRNMNCDIARLQLIFINKHIHRAIKWFKKWKLNVDPAKYMTVIFGRTRAHRILHIVVDKVPVTVYHKFKYLGIIISHKLNFRKNITNIIIKST